MDMDTSPIAAVIVAGGRGRRMNARVPKQYLEIKGMPILVRTLKVFAAVVRVDRLVLVVPPADMGFCRREMLMPHGLQQVQVVAGGADRQASVVAGLRHLVDREFPGEGIVLIHDGVRPFVDEPLIRRCVEGAMAHGGAVPALAVVDTLKRGDDRRRVIETVARENLYQVQTPQAFRFFLIMAAHAHARKTGFRGTDDASLVEALQGIVHLVPGDGRNIKITTPEDLVLGEFLVATAGDAQ